MLGDHILTTIRGDSGHLVGGYCPCCGGARTASRADDAERFIMVGLACI